MGKFGRNQIYKTAHTIEGNRAEKFLPTKIILRNIKDLINIYYDLVSCAKYVYKKKKNIIPFVKHLSVLNSNRILKAIGLIEVAQNFFHY